MTTSPALSGRRWPLGVLLLLATASFADERRLVVRLSAEQGLSQSAVNCLLQDRRGFLWIGTQDGLNRYDGRQFTVLNGEPHDPESLSDNNVTALLESRDGVLWVGTQNGGLNRYDRVSGRFTRYVHDPKNPRSIGSNGVVAIRQDAAGDLWIGTWGGGLSRFHPASGMFASFRHDPADPGSISNNNVWSVVVDRTGTVWAGTYNGLNRLDRGQQRFVRYRAGQGDGIRLTHNNIAALLEDAAGTLWIGTWGGGLLALDRSRQSLRSFRRDPANEGSLSDDRVWSLGEDAGGTLWIGTGTAGLNGFDGKRFVRYLQPGEGPGSPDAPTGVPTVKVDRSGTVWAGTNGTGLFKLPPPLKPFARHSHVPGDATSLGGNNVWSLCEDERGHVWVGTLGNGLCRLDPTTGRFARYAIPRNGATEAVGETVYSLLQDASLDVWVGTGSAGLMRVDRARDRLVGFPAEPAGRAQLTGARIMALWADPDGLLWAAAQGRGLFRVDTRTGSLTQIKAEPSRPGGLASSTILCIRRTRDGSLWLGTLGEGLERYSQGAFTHFRADPKRPNALRDDRVLCLHEDAAGALWIGTWGGGLNRLSPDRTSFEVFTEKDGLPNNTIYGILEDTSGNLWLSTNRGLCRFSPETMAVRTYGVSDGLPHNEFNEGAYILGRSGRMYFGGINGFISFFPDRIRDNPHAPPVAVTSFSRSGDPEPLANDLPEGGELRLRHDENSFSIEFAALDFVAPEKNRYRYRLEGLDRVWSVPTTRHFASYTNVPAGTYTFRVQASNGDGVWNAEGSALSVVVVPPLWATPWAYLLYAVVGGGGAWLVYTSRARAHRRELAAQREELERERRVSETLRQADETMRLQSVALESAANAIVITGRDGRITWANPAFSSLTGFTADEARGQTLKILNSGIQPPEFFAALWATIGRGDVWRNELVNRRKDGAAYIEEMTITPVFDARREITHFVAIKEDVTEKRRLQQQLLQSQRMESIGTLAGGIAHDFNNLLGIIIGYTRLLTELAAGNELAARAVRAIEQAGQRGAALVRQILTFARKSEARFGPLDLNDLIRELVSMLLETFPRIVSIKVDLHEPLPAIAADHGQVHQALLNLSVNARDAMPQGGTLQLSTSVVGAGELRQRIPAASERPYVCVRVSDTGVGMDAQTRSRAFEPFFTTKQAGSGTGLGLAVVYGVLQTHNGFVEVDSEPGAGSVFRLYWPQADDPPATSSEAPREATVSHEGAGMILVVEDEALLRDLLEELLAGAGYRVIAARDGEEAVRQYEAHRDEVDLVLLDYGLPRLSGAEAFARLQEIDPAVQVVIVSGNLDPDLRRRLVDAGLAGFVQKPYTAEAMLGTVREVLRAR